MATATRSNSIFQSRYLFHFHTLATDGKLKIADYFRFAREHAFNKLIFLEHIRRSPTYDVDGFITEVKKTSQEVRHRGARGIRVEASARWHPRYRRELCARSGCPRHC